MEAIQHGRTEQSCDLVWRLLDLAVEKKIVEKSGAWFAYGGERLGQGRENAKQFLKDNPEIFKAIDVKVRKELGLSPSRDTETA